jgi:hypothetical protein
VKRILSAAALVLVTTLLQAASAPAQKVQVGSIVTDRLCLIATRGSYLVPSVFFPPDGPPLPHGDPPAQEQGCKRYAPLRLNRARRMTITVSAHLVTAAWFQGGGPTPVPVRSVGPAPASAWLLTLPLTSGRLVLSVWTVREIPAPWGGVEENRYDYKLSIRRTATAKPAPPPVVAEPVRPFDDAAPGGTAFGDSGR